MLLAAAVVDLLLLMSTYLSLSTYVYLPTYQHLPYLSTSTYQCQSTFIHLPTYPFIIAADPGPGIGLVLEHAGRRYQWTGAKPVDDIIGTKNLYRNSNKFEWSLIIILLRRTTAGMGQVNWIFVQRNLIKNDNFFQFDRF